MTNTAHQEHLLVNLTLDLTAPAVVAGAAYLVQDTFRSLHLAPSPVASGQIDLWESLVGLTSHAARDLADHIVAHRDHVTAAVVPL